MSWEQTVFSSMVQSIGYDPDTEELFVTWKNGRRSAYLGVPEELAVELSKAPSVGSMLNDQIKPSFKHRYVR